MISDTPQLDAALDAARRDARPVVASETGGRNRRPVTDPTEAWWYYPPTDVIMEEATRLLDTHELEIDLVGQTLGQRGQVSTTWRLRHRPSGEYMLVPWEAEPFPDQETRTHAVLGTVRWAKRCLHIELLKIPVVKRVREGDRVENGVIVSRAGATPLAPREGDKVVDGVVVDMAPPVGTDPDDFAMPEFGAPTPADEAVADPGPLPGDEVDAEAERDQLAPEADAAARGEVREPIDMAALFRRMTAWRATHQGNPRALAGASTSGPLTPEDAAAIDDFLTREGC